MDTRWHRRMMEVAALLASAFLLVQTAAAALPLGHGGHAQAQGYLGINFHDVSSQQMDSLKIKGGVEVTVVDHDGPACRSGLREHDIILQMDNHDITGEEQFRHMLHEIPAGHTVSFLIERDGQQQTISTQLANREAVAQEAWDHHMTVPEPSWHGNGFFGIGGGGDTSVDAPHHGFLGMSILNPSYTGAMLEVMGPQLADFFGATNGLLVRAIDPDSPAAVAGLHAGDVILKVDATIMDSGSEWTKAVHEGRGKPLSILILRDHKEQTLTLTPDAKKRSSVFPRLWPTSKSQHAEPVALQQGWEVQDQRWQWQTGL